MGFVILSLFQHSSGAFFDPALVLRKVQTSFPEVVLIPGDQLALRAERAEALLAEKLRGDPNGPARIVVATLRRNAQEYGPAYAFQIPIEGMEPVKGVARRYDITFLFDDVLPEGCYRRLVEFLKSFGVGKIERSTDDERQSEVLYDLPGQPHGHGSAPEIQWPVTAPQQVDSDYARPASGRPRSRHDD